MDWMYLSSHISDRKCKILKRTREMNVSNIYGKLISSKLVLILTWMEHSHMSLQVQSCLRGGFVARKLGVKTETHQSKTRYTNSF
jgi:hypothetical protein